MQRYYILLKATGESGLRECEQHITGNNTKHLIVKLKKKPDTRRKNRRNQP